MNVGVYSGNGSIGLYCTSRGGWTKSVVERLARYSRYSSSKIWALLVWLTPLRWFSHWAATVAVPNMRGVERNGRVTRNRHSCSVRCRTLTGNPLYSISAVSSPPAIFAVCERYVGEMTIGKGP